MKMIRTPAYGLLKNAPNPGRRFLVALAPFPRAFGNRFGSRARLSGEPTHKNRQLRRLAFTELPALKLMSCIPTNWIPIGY